MKSPMEFFAICMDLISEALLLLKAGNNCCPMLTEKLLHMYTVGYAGLNIVLHFKLYFY